MPVTGAQLFVKALKEEHVEVLFAYPGGQAIDLFDALYGENEIPIILPRHEQGLVHAADGYARSTGKTGVCLVTSGPGATNLVTGIATANYDSVPLVCFTGQVPTSLIGNDAFQEVDIVGITRSICKYAVTVRRREDLGTVIKNAFYIARSGRPGVVVVDIPKDIQQAVGEERYPESVSIRGYKPSSGVHPGQIKKAAELLSRAKRPLFLAGGGVRISRAEAEFTQLAEAAGIPVVTTIMGKGALPSGHPLYVGNIGIHGSFAANSAVSSCDVLCSIGTRFNDRITGKNGTFACGASIIHIDVDPASISRNIAVDIPIVADAGEAVSALLKRISKQLCYDRSSWLTQIHGWQTEHPLAERPLAEHPLAESSRSTSAVSDKSAAPNTVRPQWIFHQINRLFEHAVISTDVGQNQLWATQFLELGPDRLLLTSGGLGTMGYGLPAGIGAKIGNPDTDVIVISGDGGMQMNIQELATAVVYELPVIICVLNNGCLGNVRQWQELFYQKRYSGTCLRRRKSCPAKCGTPSECCPPYVPDFIQLAAGYGAKGIRVTCGEAVEPAFLEAKRNTLGPTVIEFVIGSEENVFPIVPPGSPLDTMIFKK